MQRRTGWLGLGVLAVATACGRSPETASAPLDERLQAAIRDRAEEADPREKGIGRMLPDFTYTDVAGNTGRLSALGDGPIVIAIRDVGCPVSLRTAAELARIEDAYRPRGVGFLFLNLSPHNTVEEILADVAEQGFDGPTVHDPDQDLGRLLEATTTTEVFLLDARRTLVYRGAIDDQVGRGYTRPAPERTFLRDALDETLANRPVSFPSTDAPGCLLGIEPVETSAAQPATYHREIARIVQRNCVECHRTGGAGPFPLETYDQVRGRKGMIAMVVDEGIMPPWFAADDTGPWANDRRLSTRERETLLAWIDAGAPAGDPADTPLPLVHREGWTIGQPDLVFQLEHEAEIPAEGTIDFRYFLADREVEDDLWIQAMQVLPTDPEVVHHVTMMFKPPQEVSDAFESDLRTALLPWSVRATDGWQFLFPYLPGNGPRSHPSGVARFLPKGSQLRFDMHYTPNGKATHDRTRFGIVLAKQPPIYLDESRNIWQPNLAIPPGVADIAFEQTYTIRHDVVLQSLTPHMHLRGKGYQVELLRPDGSREELLRLKAWDPGWQFTYTFARPPVVPRGSRLHFTGWYDNSSDNPYNPDPTRWVHDGPQVWDEMLTLVVEWVRPRPVGQP